MFDFDENNFKQVFFSLLWHLENRISLIILTDLKQECLVWSKVRDGENILYSVCKLLVTIKCVCLCKHNGLIIAYSKYDLIYIHV